jgi:hypothetical protein
MTDASDAMKRILIDLKPLFKNDGFRKSGSTFNRSLPGGITHVVNFQMSHDPEPRSDDIPGRTFAVHGKFTVNLGIRVAGIKEYSGWELPLRKDGFVAEFHCQIRQRIGALLPGGNDKWWLLTDARERHEENVVRELQAGLIGYGFPWFSPSATQEGLMEALQQEATYLDAVRSASLLARIHVVRGELVEAQEAYAIWARGMIIRLRSQAGLTEDDIRHRLTADAERLGLIISEEEFDYES